MVLVGVAGGILKGSMVALKGLSVAQSVGFLLGTATVTNFASGMGAYAIRLAGDRNKKFNAREMIWSGIGQSAKGITSFYFGGMMVGAGFWNVGKGAKNTINPIIRGISKFPSTFVPYKIIDDLCFSY